jgi:basic amino acid/polyamine antiporter, APA family
LAPADDALPRRLGLGAATALVVGEVIGVGIFLTPAEMAQGLGSPFWLLTVWLFVGATAFCGALCFGELAARFPEAGGGYVYLREAWGPGVAFLYGWQSLLVMDPGLTAALGAGFAEYFGYLVPLPPALQKVVAVGAILLLALVNALGARWGAGLLTVLTAAKLLLLATLIGWGFASGRGDWGHFVPFVTPHPGTGPLVGGLAGGLIAAFFSYGGFWDVSKLAGEVKDPGRVLPRALALGVGSVTLIYILTSAVFLYLVPFEGAASGAAFAATAGERMFGPIGGSVFAAIVLVAVLGSMAAFLMAAPRVYYAMARDRVFLASVAAVHPRFGTPVRAIVLQALLGSVLLWMGSFGEIVAYFIFVTLAFVALTVAGLYRLPRPAAGVFRVPGYPATPLGFLLLLGMLLLLLGMGRPAQAALGVAVVALGVPVYRFWVAPRQRQTR